MAVQTVNFTTGPSTLPDMGTLAYNGCTFSPLFHTEVSGKIIKDDARRTTKLMEYKLSVEGYVTLQSSALSISPNIATMRRLLQACGGALTYTGRGFDLTAANTEVMWGPVPELIEFQPLGGGLSAKVKWDVTFRTPDVPVGTHLPRGGNAAKNLPLLQFNYETSLTYGEDYYSSMTVKGTMEIPMNRGISIGVDRRTLTTTIDDVRTELDNKIFSGIDLSRFYIIKREYNVSRDKRVMNFDVQIDEKPYMDLPINCSVARGSYNVRPAKSGPGLVLWMCTLRATYTVRADFARRWAWDAFLLLLQLRMKFSSLANVPRNDRPQDQNPTRSQPINPVLQGVFDAGSLLTISIPGFTQRVQEVINRRTVNNNNAPGAWLIDFSFDEGLYKDSKTVTFSATWRMVTTLSHILLASGIWKKLPEKDTTTNKNLWATSMADVSGALGVLPNYLDPSRDVIIDFGY